MKEPVGTYEGEDRPYSLMPVDWLQRALSALPGENPGDRCDGLPVEFQIDFRRRYAAILLRGHGL